VQQELIVEIHRTAIWPVVVTVDGNISKTSNTDFIDRDGSYIILIQDGNLDNLENEILGLANDGNRSFKFLWNSEARFVVAGANTLTNSQQENIFYSLSYFRIYNCIILSQEHYVTEKLISRPMNVNYVDTGMKLGVYTWFPYRSSDRCTEVNDITLLDSWVISAQGHFTKNTDLFPQKIGKSFNGCPTKPIIENMPGLVTTKLVNYINSNANAKVFGLEMILLLNVLQQMNMSFVLVTTPNEIEDLPRFFFFKECLYSLRWFYRTFYG
jgi:hypothetical protein